MMRYFRICRRQTVLRSSPKIATVMLSEGVCPSRNTPAVPEIRSCQKEFLLASEPTRCCQNSLARQMQIKHTRGPSTPPVDSQANQPAALRMTKEKVLLP